MGDLIPDPPAFPVTPNYWRCWSPMAEEWKSGDSACSHKVFNGWTFVNTQFWDLTTFECIRPDELSQELRDAIVKVKSNQGINNDE